MCGVQFSCGRVSRRSFRSWCLRIPSRVEVVFTARTPGFVVLPIVGAQARQADQVDGIEWSGTRAGEIIPGEQGPIAPVRTSQSYAAPGDKAFTAVLYGHQQPPGVAFGKPRRRQFDFLAPFGPVASKVNRRAVEVKYLLCSPGDQGQRCAARQILECPRCDAAT